MKTLLNLLRKITPQPVMLTYHKALAMISAIVYGFPGRSMVVIGVTGTKGKTTAANFIWSCLTAGGFKTGIISSANIRIGKNESLNRNHMTMPGRFAIQSLLSKMKRAGCTHCVVETTSEGLKQSRHIGVPYDIAVFTNLTPEHLPSHGGSFERYKATKGKMFKALSRHDKRIGGKRVQKVIIANADSEHADYFLGFKADRRATFGTSQGAETRVTDIVETQQGVRFSAGESKFTLSIMGAFNVMNALPAIMICRLQGMQDRDIAKGLESLSLIPGRMELIDEGQDFTVIVDYAHEKQSITNVLVSARSRVGQAGCVIILLGAEGGGRDKAKRPVMGGLAAKMADYVIVSNVDPYSDDPAEIIEDIAQASEKAGKTRGKDLFAIEDRKQGIRKAVSLAKAGDMVLITGKGAEQSIVIDGKSRPWDDRKATREAIKQRLSPC